MLTSTEVRARLHIGRDKLARLIKNGELEAIRTGDAKASPYRFSEETVDAYIRRRTVQPDQEAS